MKLHALLLPPVLLLGACQTGLRAPPMVAASAPPISPDVAAEAERLFDAVAAHYPALNVTVRRRGAIVWERTGGTARDPRDGVERDYNFYSTAKMLTGLAYARLEQEGLDLGRSVRTIDPQLPAAYQPVTLRHLLTHTSGVRHYRQGGEDWVAFSARRCAVPADALPHFIDDPLSFPPGERLQYSSYGFVLLSHLLVRVTGEPTYDAAMRRVLGDAYTEQTDRQGADKGVAYLSQNGAFTPMPNLSAECKFGAGGLIASARDLALTGEALYAGRIVDLARAPGVFAPTSATNPFAYGAVVRVVDGIHTIGHSGGSPGGRGYLEVWMEPRVAVGLTGNVEGPGLGELAAGLARLFAASQPGR